MKEATRQQHEEANDSYGETCARSTEAGVTERMEQPGTRATWRIMVTTSRRDAMLQRYEQRRSAALSQLRRILATASGLQSAM